MRNKKKIVPFSKRMVFFLQLKRIRYRSQIYSFLLRRDIVKIQQNWIGQCDGTKIDFQVFNSNDHPIGKLPVWTDKPELIFSANSIFIKPENILYKENRVAEGL